MYPQIGYRASAEEWVYNTEDKEAGGRAERGGGWDRDRDTPLEQWRLPIVAIWCLSPPPLWVGPAPTKAASTTLPGVDKQPKRQETSAIGFPLPAIHPKPTQALLNLPEFTSLCIRHTGGSLPSLCASFSVSLSM